MTHGQARRTQSVSGRPAETSAAGRPAHRTQQRAGPGYAAEARTAGGVQRGADPGERRSRAKSAAGIRRHPRTVWSLYRPIAKSDTEPGQEPSGGRFWAAAAIRCNLLRELGGFAEITRPTFDQEHLQLWQHVGGEPARPDDFAAPQYVYGWGRAPRHVSLEMGDRGGWYENYAARLKTAPLGEPQALEIRMDRQTRAIYAACWSEK